jgi:poly(3-hydroxyoctanoate) depolymerase
VKIIVLLLGSWLMACAAAPGPIGVDGPDEDEEPITCAISADTTARCIEFDGCIACTFETAILSKSSDDRRVQYQVPLGTAPAEGWPAVILFQGSGYGGEVMWSSTDTELFGGFFETRLIAKLLQNGYAVLTPETLGAGKTYWQSNILNHATNWESSADHGMMLALFEAIDGGQFGALDRTALRAAGISSGGFMTSRMAASYPGQFQALAIQSGGWATFPVAPMPVTLPADHPPTLFLHGSQDFIVPLAAAKGYHASLRDIGVATELITAEVPHQWLVSAADEVAAWFKKH